MIGLAVIAVVFSTVLGGCVGSFLNVVVWRLPNGLSLIRPGSFCPKCQHPIRFYDNIPVFGWLFLGGKCRDCGLPISPRYPIIESLCAAVAGFFAALIFFGHWAGPVDSALYWDKMAGWAEVWARWSRGDLFFLPVTPERILFEGLGMTFLWSGLFYLFLAVGLILWDGFKTPRLLTFLLTLTVAGLAICPYFREGSGGNLDPKTVSLWVVLGKTAFIWFLVYMGFVAWRKMVWRRSKPPLRLPLSFSLTDGLLPLLAMVTILGKDIPVFVGFYCFVPFLIASGVAPKGTNLAAENGEKKENAEEKSDGNLTVNAKRRALGATILISLFFGFGWILVRAFLGLKG